MGCLSATRKAELIAERTTLQTHLAAINSAYNSALTDGIESYKLDSGEGSSAVKYRSLKDLDDAIDRVSSRINTINALLRGTNLVNTNLRRK